MANRNSTNSTRSLAFHAAAHAVIAHSMGRAVELVDISDHKDHATHPENQFEAMETVVIKLAGMYAQARAGGTTLLAAFADGGQADYDEAAKVAHQIVDAGYARHIDDVWRQAEWDVDLHLRQHWHRIQRVVTALIERGKLGAYEFEALYRR